MDINNHDFGYEKYDAMYGDYEDEEYEDDVWCCDTCTHYGECPKSKGKDDYCRDYEEY